MLNLGQDLAGGLLTESEDEVGAAWSFPTRLEVLRVPGVGVTIESVGLWLKQADFGEARREDGLTSDEREELGQLRRRVRFSSRRKRSKKGGGLPRRGDQPIR